jgi:hypothetical protein
VTSAFREAIHYCGGFCKDANRLVEIARLAGLEQPSVYIFGCILRFVNILERTLFPRNRPGGLFARFLGRGSTGSRLKTFNIAKVECEKFRRDHVSGSPHRIWRENRILCGRNRICIPFEEP